MSNLESTKNEINEIYNIFFGASHNFIIKHPNKKPKPKRSKSNFDIPSSIIQQDKSNFITLDTTKNNQMLTKGQKKSIECATPIINQRSISNKKHKIDFKHYSKLLRLPLIKSPEKRDNICRKIIITNKKLFTNSPNNKHFVTEKIKANLKIPSNEKMLENKKLSKILNAVLRKDLFLNNINDNNNKDDNKLENLKSRNGITSLKTDTQNIKTEELLFETKERKKIKVIIELPKESLSEITLQNFAKNEIYTNIPTIILQNGSTCKFSKEQQTQNFDHSENDIFLNKLRTLDHSVYENYPESIKNNNFSNSMLNNDFSYKNNPILSCKSISPINYYSVKKKMRRILTKKYSSNL